ncbi:family 43 glycosylhydrolase [Mucilaginibacter dorajii]|uniref:Ricin B lectin domain-containing protein n=1 Tax=Mucilaginibacter dorajii TaxID=692994 RepID=A0ABP7R152_9SPHI|nr:family 43 glycosylhydrolase [Mucilaginibacter dorajii]MCS3732144.1 arabinan endo-1,5-alpha-L-arabinosidase [Mucilaginibacter dorajii]
MKLIVKVISTIALFSLLSTRQANAQVGKPFIHDPSTIAECDGKYYTFGTFGGGLISDDGWTWNGGAVRPGGGAAPDVLKIGDRYLIVYGATGGGLAGGHNGKILTMWNKSLDPKSPDFKYSEPVEVASSDGIEDNDAIDPGLLLDPTDGRLWLSYGTYFGYIRLVELDPKTGKRVEGNKALNIAIDCEATDLLYRDGWYYLLGTHGTCCDGPNSTYNIVVGRSRKVTGPYIDNIGRGMLKGGGKMVVAAGDRLIGPGHFGRIVIADGVEKMSCHYEADLDQSGRSVLGIRPLLWKNGWPVAGDNLKEGTYEIESERRGYALELRVDFTRMPGGMRFNRNNDEPVKPVPSQELADVVKSWPTGNIGVRINDYMFRPHQKWAILQVPGAGGYLGGPYYKIVIAGTDRALAATAESELISVPTFTGAPEQLWRIDQLTDGTYRIMPKVVPNSKEQLALVSSGDSTPTLAKFDMNSDNSKWNFRVH